LGHLQFDQDEAEKNEILDTSTCIPCMLPYCISQYHPLTCLAVAGALAR
jgi:oleate hydratase